jgi:SET domain-containing protein
MGCFTNERIARGQVVWIYDPRLDLTIRQAALPAFPPAMQQFLLMYGYMEERDGEVLIILCGDHSKHMNHSDSPNLGSVLENGLAKNLALRDVEAGEELTCDYGQFDLDADRNLGRA